MNSSLISIIIVNWNSSGLLRNCLNSIIETNLDRNYEIIVVDNASTDDSVKMVKSEFPDVVLIENKENLGFAKANNIGIKASNGDIILLLNSDAELKTPNTLKKVNQFLAKHSEIGILGLNLIFPNGVPQSPGGKFISTWQLFKQQILLLNSPLAYQVKSKLQPAKNTQFYEIDYVTGACFFVRKEVIRDVGLLNESFFMYGEDMEFCYRAKQKGWRSAILPSIEVVHSKGQSTKKNIEQILSHSINNNCLLIKRFYGNTSAFLAYLIYILGTFIRFVLAFLRKNEKPMVYLKLMRNTIKLRKDSG
ncbi:glycosyltransferase family 2 protein [candidate division KSB1 bacterium]|nr:MAG: glycosyltransferase family 2 protein [candidate division KSB1 bacterium]